MRRGRKRKTDARRDARGKSQNAVSSLQREREAKAVVLEARCRLYGLATGPASLQEAGSAVGRLYLAGMINSAQWGSVAVYEQVVSDYRTAIEVRRLGSAGDFNRNGGYDGREGDEPTYAEKCRTAERRYLEAKRALRNVSSLAHLALAEWVIEDREPWSLLGDLRLGLDALVKLWCVDTRNREKAA